MPRSERFSRNPFSKKQQQLVRESRMAIVGLGGTGGFILENLVRAGAEDLLVFDRDRFEESNLNRQMLATGKSLGRKKSSEAVARAESINPDAKILPGGEFSSGSSVPGCRIILDGSDDIGTKLAIAESAKKRKIPFVYCSATGFRGMVSVFFNYEIKKAFQIGAGGGMGHRKNLPVLSCAPAVAGSLAASQAINYLIGKPYIRAPLAQFFDLSEKEMFWRAELG